MQRQVARRPAARAQARAGGGRRGDPDEQQQGEGGGERDRADAQPPRERARRRRVSGRPRPDGVRPVGVRPLDRRQPRRGPPQPADREREPHVAVLPAAVQLGAPAATGDPVVQLAGHLDDAQAGLQHVDGQADLDAPAAGQRAGRVERGPAQAAHARQRLRRAPAGEARRCRRGPAGRRSRARRRRCAAAAGWRCVMSAVPAATGGTSTPRLAALASRSASTKSRCRGRRSRRGSAWSCSAAIRAPVVIAAALPRLRAWRTTSAPAARASVGGVVGAAVVDDDHEVDARDGRRPRRRSRRCGPPRPWRG